MQRFPLELGIKKSENSTGPTPKNKEELFFKTKPYPGRMNKNRYKQDVK